MYSCDTTIHFALLEIEFTNNIITNLNKLCITTSKIKLPPMDGFLVTKEGENEKTKEV